MADKFSCGGMEVASPLVIRGKTLAIDETRVEGIEEQIGDLSELRTDHKSDLVSAINELTDREIDEEVVYTGYIYKGKPIYRTILNSSYIGSISDTQDWIDIGLTISDLDTLITIQSTGHMRGRLDYNVQGDKILVHSTHGAIGFSGDVDFVVEYTLAEQA